MKFTCLPGVWLLFATLLHLTPASKACKCCPYPEYTCMERTIEWFDHYPYVFTAVIDSVQTPPEEWWAGDEAQSVYLTVKTVYKGNVPAQLCINSQEYRSSCGQDYRGDAGNTFVFYALLDRDGNINSHGCSGSHRFYSKQEIDSLEYGDFFTQCMLQEEKFFTALTNQTNGEFNFNFSNGQPQSKGKLKNGLPDGKWIYYTFWGEKRCEGNYENGIRSGIWTEYEYETTYEEAGGKRIAHRHLLSYRIGEYVNGKPDGVWKNYNEKGEFISGIKFDAYFNEWISVK